MVGTQRYWDGHQWTDHIAPNQPPTYATPPAALRQEDHTGLIIAGVLTAIFIPFVGFIIGIVLMARNKVGPGLGCMIISVVAFFVWLSALTPDPTYGY